MRKLTRIGVVAIALGLCAAGGGLWLRAADEKPAAAAPAGGKTRFFEMRTYTTNPGKLDALNARFRDHTNRLFQKHGIEMVGYWVPTDPERSKDTLVYILAYPDKEARDKAWKEFQDDPDWKKAKADSEKDGVLVKKVDQVFMTPTDYSPVK
jgi:hypothetical protein